MSVYLACGALLLMWLLHQLGGLDGMVDGLRVILSPEDFEVFPEWLLLTAICLIIVAFWPIFMLRSLWR